MGLRHQHDGLPPLSPVEAGSDYFVFANVSAVFQRTNGAISLTHQFVDRVVVHRGTLSCIGSSAACIVPYSAPIVNLEGGVLGPALTVAGSVLGLIEIGMEPSTGDGYTPDPLVGSMPKVLGGDNSLIRATDGLIFGTRDAL
jgi:hypothetical protein